MALPSKVVLFLAALVCLQCVSAKSPIRAISDDRANKFDKEVASKEIKEDVMSFLDAYDGIRDDLQDIANKFDKTRVKDVGIRKCADWAIAMARVYELEGVPHADKILEAMKELADMLLSARKTGHSYVEDKVMRGWPMYVSEDDKEPIHESFNFGHIGKPPAPGKAVCSVPRANVSTRKQRHSYLMI